MNPQTSAPTNGIPKNWKFRIPEKKIQDAVDYTTIDDDLLVKQHYIYRN